jgi:site-specific recombinase XerD
MAALELIGYTNEQTQDLKEKISPHLVDLEFKKDIVWVHEVENYSRVIDLNNNSRPFLRVYTRSRERAFILRDRINYLFDIEVIYINISVIKGKILEFQAMS